MSLDLSIFAVVPSTDPKFKKYVEVYKACAAAGVGIPAEVIAEFMANTFTRTSFRLSKEARQFAKKLVDVELDIQVS
jgi:hypothetical protein